MTLETLRSTSQALRALLDEDASHGGEGLSQTEMASRLGVDRATISRALAQLRRTAEVKARRGHVPGQAYRVLVYRLTRRGRIRGRHAVPSPWRDLPPVGDLFVGRTREVAQVRQGLARGGILVVDGVSGVGKSALVRRAVGALGGPVVVLWTRLLPTTPPSALEDQLTRVGDRGPTPTGDPGSLLPPTTTSLAHHAALFLEHHPQGVVWVLDGLEEASVATQEAVREVLSSFRIGGPHAAVIVTQRELPWPLPHPAAVHLTLRGLSRKDALQLCRAIGVPEDRFETCFRETLGMPRFLRLAPRVGVAPGTTFASAVLRSVPSRQRGALLFLALAWGPLPRRPGSPSGLSREEVDALVSLSVLEASEGGLQLPDPVARRLRETASYEELHQAHRALAFSHLLSPAERFVHAAEVGEVRFALDLLAHHRNELAGTADPRVQEGALHLSHLLRPGRRRGGLLLLVAEVQRLRGDFVAASTFLERALEELPERDPEAVHAAATLSLTALRAGHRDHAERWAQTVAGLSRTHRWAAAAAVAPGNVVTYRGELARGKQLLEEAERLARTHRQPEVRLVALHGLGYIAGREGDTAREEWISGVGADLARAQRRDDFVRIFHVMLAQAASQRGRREETVALYRKVREESQAAGDRAREVIALVGLAREEGRAGNSPEAVRLAREGARVAEGAQDRSITAMAYSALAWWLRSGGHLDEARDLSRRALRLSREVGPSPSSRQVRDVWKELSSLPRPPSTPSTGRWTERLGTIEPDPSARA